MTETWAYFSLNFNSAGFPKKPLQSTFCKISKVQTNMPKDIMMIETWRHSQPTSDICSSRHDITRLLHKTTKPMSMTEMVVENRSRPSTKIIITTQQTWHGAIQFISPSISSNENFAFTYKKESHVSSQSRQLSVIQSKFHGQNLGNQIFFFMVLLYDIIVSYHNEILLGFGSVKDYLFL